MSTFFVIILLTQKHRRQTYLLYLKTNNIHNILFLDRIYNLSIHFNNVICIIIFLQVK